MNDISSFFFFCLENGLCCCAMLLHIDVLEEMEKSIAHIISTGEVPGLVLK